MSEQFQNLPFTLKDLIDIREWQKIQDNFAAVTGVSLRTVDPEGNLITKPSHEPRLCVCKECLPTFLGGKAIVDRNLSFFCEAGLYNLLKPLRYEHGDVLAYLIVGPVILVAQESKEHYRKTAEDLNMSLEDFWKALMEIKVMSFQGIRSLGELIKDLSEYIIRFAYENKVRVSRALAHLEAARLKKILDSLLQVAFEISKADIGSLMVLDQKAEFLTINSSRGIPEEIADRTRVRLGEGISGVAAQENKSFLINDELEDNRINSLLRRPYLGSSMVIPLKVEDKVLGVMNLGTLKTSAAQFNTDTLKLMSKLIGLVNVPCGK